MREKRSDSLWLRGLAKSLAAGIILAALAAASFYFFYMKPRWTVPILMYHGVNDTEGSTLFVSPRNFERQMRFLHDDGYNVISFDALVKGISEKKVFPPKTVVITFDDGYVDNYVNAFPVLARYKMPAIIFIATAYVSKEEGYLTWDQVRLMQSNRMDFGGHTRDHVYLPDVKDESVLAEEVAGCKVDIEKNTGKRADYFCYPSGGYDDRVLEAVKKAGYKGACTTNRGKDRANRDVYELNRVKVTDSDANKPLHFRAKLSGYYNLFRRIKYDDAYDLKKK